MRSQKRGSRNGKKRFQCMDCFGWFEIDHRQKKKLLIDYIDGKPIRKIADKERISPATTFRKIEKEMEALPHNNAITKGYCSRFCGIIIVDGKYVKVKGYEKKIPLLWGIDYLSHDIPVYEMAVSESYEAWLKYFGYLKSIKYPLKIVISDDNENIGKAAKYIFPKVTIQICHNHYLENIRKALKVRTEEKHQEFIKDLKKAIFSMKMQMTLFNKRLRKLYRKYEKDDAATSYLVKIFEDRKKLIHAAYVKKAPRDTNLIELYNSHLQARLKSIKGFKSFAAADKWLNAYIIRRRFKPFTDCCHRFRHLNGKSAVSVTAKKGAVLPLFY